jgi:hypothetical protein
MDRLSAELLFIKWFKSPTVDSKSQSKFIDDMTRWLEDSPHPIYFLSDLRTGRIMDAMTIQRLGKLTYHANYGGGVAFSKDFVAGLFVGMFSKFAEPERGDSVFFETVDQALAKLESIKPGITREIDWHHFGTQWANQK